MTFKEFIKPTWWRIGVTFFVFVVWVFLAHTFSVVSCNCQPYGLVGCVDYYSYMIYVGDICHCVCVPLGDLIVNYLWYGILPLIVIYLIVGGVFYTIEVLKKK